MPGAARQAAKTAPQQTRACRSLQPGSSIHHCRKGDSAVSMDEQHTDPSNDHYALSQFRPPAGMSAPPGALEHISARGRRRVQRRRAVVGSVCGVAAVLVVTSAVLTLRTPVGPTTIMGQEQVASQPSPSDQRDLRPTQAPSDPSTSSATPSGCGESSNEPSASGGPTQGGSSSPSTTPGSGGGSGSASSQPNTRRVIRFWT